MKWSFIVPDQIPQQILKQKHFGVCRAKGIALSRADGEFVIDAALNSHMIANNMENTI